MLTHPRRPQAPIEQRKAERELFFWTAFQALKLIVAGTMVAYVVFSLIAGDLHSGNLLLRYIGAG